MSYEDRKKYSRNKTGRKLLEIIARKKSNLAVAADVGTIDEMLSIADQVGAVLGLYLSAVCSPVHVRGRTRVCQLG